MQITPKKKQKCNKNPMLGDPEERGDRQSEQQTTYHMITLLLKQLQSPRE